MVRAIADPDNVDAEFGIIVRSDLKGGGLGDLLMQQMIDYLRAARHAAAGRDRAAENTRMLELARELGFAESPNPDEPGTRWIELPLQP